MIKNVIIIGDHIQALGMVRIAKRNNLRVILFCSYPLALPRFSRYTDKYSVYKDASNFYYLFNKYESLCPDTLIIPTDDITISLIMQRYDYFKKYFLLALASKESTEICYNKINTYKLCNDLDIPCPKSYFPTEEEQIYKIISELQFPVIIKPAIMHKLFKATGKKVYLCRSEDELISNYRKITNLIPKDEVIIQEYLRGGPKVLYSYGTVAFRGNILSGFGANRIRQKPMDFGVATTFAKSVNIEEIKEYSTIILNKIEYSGFAEVEFMFDNKVNKYKLLEINPRSWKWHTIANKLNIDLLKDYVAALEGRGGDSLNIYNNKINEMCWIERVTDLFTVVQEIISRRMSIHDYYKSLKCKKESACWSLKDPLPAIMYIILLPYLFYKRT